MGEVHPAWLRLSIESEEGSKLAVLEGLVGSRNLGGFSELLFELFILLQILLGLEFYSGGLSKDHKFELCNV